MGRISPEDVMNILEEREYIPLGRLEMSPCAEAIDVGGICVTVGFQGEIVPCSEPCSNNLQPSRFEQEGVWSGLLVCTCDQLDRFDGNCNPCGACAMTQSAIATHYVKLPKCSRDEAEVLKASPAPKVPTIQQSRSQSWVPKCTVINILPEAPVRTRNV